MKKLWVLLILTYAVSYCSSIHAQSMSDSVANRLLSAIRSSESDTEKVKHLVAYSSWLADYYPDSAVVFAQQALSLSEKNNFARGKINALISLGWNHTKQGKYELGAVVFDQAIAVSQKEYTSLLPTLYNYQASNYGLAGNYRAAAEYYYKLIELVETQGDSSINLTLPYMNLYALWKDLGDDSIRYAYVNKAEAETKRHSSLHNDFYMQETVYLTKGDLLASTDPKQAEEYYLKAMAISKKNNTKMSEAYIHGSLAYLYLNQGKMELAEKHMKKFFDLSRYAKSNHQKLEIFINYSKMNRLLKDYEAAAHYAKLGLEMAVKINSPTFILSSLESLNELYSEMELYNKAYLYQQWYAKIKDSISGQNMLKEIDLLEHEYQLARKEKELTLQKLHHAEIDARANRYNIYLILVIMLTGMITLFYVIQRRNYLQKIRLEQENNAALQKEQELNNLQVLMESEDKERKRISMELHDGIGSMLSVAKLNLNALENQFQHNEYHKGIFKKMNHILTHSSVEVRDTAHSLVPDVLLKGGLEEAFKIYCYKILKQSAIHFQSFGKPIDLEKELTFNIFRAIQQTMDLLTTHTDNEHYLLQLNWQKDELYITLDIYGKEGWVEDELKEDTSLDWQEIKERIRLTNGIIDIDAPDEDCTTLNFEFPYQIYKDGNSLSDPAG